MDENARRRARNQEIIEEFRAEGGTSGAFPTVPLLLLHHVGAKSGVGYVSPPAYLPDGERWVVYAANGGRPAHPAWYFNLRAHAETLIEVGTETVPVTARIVAGDEREELVGRFREQSPFFGDFAKATEREIPVFVLERVAG